MNHGPRLLKNVRRASDGEVLHLLLELIDGSDRAELLSFAHGVEMSLGKGTEFEMNQKANLEILDWVSEGFHRAGRKAFEPSRRTVALAKRLGHSVVYDSRFKQFDSLPLNATGAIPLDEWPGLPGTNGSSYVYALDNLHIHAQPRAAALYPTNIKVGYRICSNSQAAAKVAPVSAGPLNRVNA